MNRSRQELGRAGLVSDGGATRCQSCHDNLRLEFGTDGEGRATESCSCGYRAYVKTRGSVLRSLSE